MIDIVGGDEFDVDDTGRYRDATTRGNATMSTLDMFLRGEDDVAIGGMSGIPDIIGADHHGLAEVGDMSDLDLAIGEMPALRLPGEDMRRSEAGEVAKYREACKKLVVQNMMLRKRNLVNPEAVAVTRRGATRKREFPLGFDSGVDVPAGAQVIITSFPQVLFRGERLIVPSNIALFFTVDDVIVGKNSQTVDPTPLPAATFVENAVGVRLHIDTAEPGKVVSLRVTNIDPANARRFRAALIGTAVE